MMFTFFLSIFFFSSLQILGGNQRENDREKAQKKLGNQKKPTESGSSLAARKAIDAERMKQKEVSFSSFPFCRSTS